MSPTEICALVYGFNAREAQHVIETAGLLFRIIRRDGHACVLTRDYRTDRIGVEIVDDLVVSAQIG